MSSSKDIYEEQIKAALEHKVVYHYTNKEGLEAILKHESLRLSSLSIVNDPEENRRITSIWHNKIYVICFTYTKNDKYFKKFYNYNYRLDVPITKLTNIKNVYSDDKCNHKLENFSKFGNRSDILHTSYNKWSDWTVYDVSLVDVKYDNNLENYITNKEEINAGIVKRAKGIDDKYNEREWQIEKETRLRVTIRSIGFEHIKGNTYGTIETVSPSLIENGSNYLYVKLPESVEYKCFS